MGKGPMYTAPESPLVAFDLGYQKIHVHKHPWGALDFSWHIFFVDPWACPCALLRDLETSESSKKRTPKNRARIENREQHQGPVQPDKIKTTDRAKLNAERTSQGSTNEDNPRGSGDQGHGVLLPIPKYDPCPCPRCRE